MTQLLWVSRNEVTSCSSSPGTVSYTHLDVYKRQHHPRVHEITIIPRGQAGGYTMYLPEKDRSYVTKGEMFEDIVSSLGGRVAEQLILEDISTGASNDLQQATNIARQRCV